MKALLMSIHGRHIEKIATLLKVDELRKRIPKLQPPYKVYAYETKDNSFEGIGFCSGWNNGNRKYIHHPGKVTLEFIVDRVDEAPTKNISPETIKLAEDACVSVDRLCHYFDGETATGLHITNVKIYDKPKELSEFRLPCDKFLDCLKCHRGRVGDRSCQGQIERAPESWCYVEEL